VTALQPERNLIDMAPQLRRGVIRLGRRLRAERPADALSPNKVGVLSHLLREGPATPGKITAAEHQKPQALTRVFADLQADGLVTRIASDVDGRSYVLALTAAGHAALARDMAVRDHWLVAALGQLSDTEVQVLGIAGPLLDRLADAMPAE
jgi:DNA-binding MarR family transcriptional regulator